MKLILELYNTRYTIESARNDYDGNELKELFSRIMVAASFSPSVLEPEDGGRWRFCEDDEVVVKKGELEKGDNQ